MLGVQFLPPLKLRKKEMAMPDQSVVVGSEIVLEGIVLNHEACAWYEGGAFSARMVREALSEIGGDVVVRVNSAGGDPFEGEAIRAALESHGGRVTVFVNGVAASAASLMIMSADHIEMSRGSFLMIHNPSACMCGTADEMRAEAQVLDELAAGYASVYAARSGQSVEAVLKMMNDTTYMSAVRAEEIGFANAVTENPVRQDTASSAVPEMLAAQFQTAISTFQSASKALRAGGTPSPALSTGTAGLNPAMSADTQEQNMPDNIPAVETTVNTPPAALATSVPETGSPDVTMSTPSASEIEHRARRQERERISGIRQIAEPFMSAGSLSEADLAGLIDDGTPLAEAGNRLMTAMAANEPPIAIPGQRVQVMRDETDTRVEGLVQALMRDYSGPGEQYRGMRLRGLAMELAGTRRGPEMSVIRQGMSSVAMMGGAHGISDFAYITTEVMGRSLLAEYDRRGANWNIITGTPLSANDFRELHSVRFGGDFQMKTVLENGEYQEATLADQAEGLKVERRGRTIHLTFEAVVNDDMGAFNRIPREFAMAARVMEASIVWGIIRSNAVLKSDNTALFHTSRKNLAAAGGAISVTTVGAARKAMWEQTAYGSKDKDDFLQVVPDLLIVPPALEMHALQFAQGTTPAKDGDANPYKNTVEPVTVPHLGAAAGGSDTAWYLTARDLPPVSVAYLDGYESPTVQTVEGMNPDRVSMSARHIFGGAASEFRGAYKNAGA
jgi:ATP-dependent protease ClpP protease subunit